MGLCWAASTYAVGVGVVDEAPPPPVVVGAGVSSAQGASAKAIEFIAQVQPQSSLCITQIGKPKIMPKRFEQYLRGGDQPEHLKRCCSVVFLQPLLLQARPPCGGRCPVAPWPLPRVGGPTLWGGEGYEPWTLDHLSLSLYIYTSVNPCIYMHDAKRNRVQWLRAECNRDQHF